MATYHDVFVRPTVAGANLLSDLEATLGSRPTAHTDGGEGYVVGYDGAWIDVILEHELVDDAGLPFSRYPYYLTVRLPGRDELASREIARRIRRLITNTGRYDAFIVWNDINLVDPEPSPGG